MEEGGVTVSKSNNTKVLNLNKTSLKATTVILDLRNLVRFLYFYVSVNHMTSLLQTLSLRVFHVTHTSESTDKNFSHLVKQYFCLKPKKRRTTGVNKPDNNTGWWDAFESGCSDWWKQIKARIVTSGAYIRPRSTTAAWALK